LSKWGDFYVETNDLKKRTGTVSVIISKNKINSSDKFRHFKTTNRKLYDEEYTAFSEKGFYEVLYLNEKDEVAEGSRTNIFLRKEDSWFTPRLDSGALPGIYRQHFIKMHPQTLEKNIKINDFRTADEIILTNTLRGEVKVNKLSISSEEYLTFNK